MLFSLFYDKILSMNNLNLKSETLKFIELNGFKSLTKVQDATIKIANKGKDVIVLSKTGTGKTHAFLIPIMEKINPAIDETQVIISSPTRELAFQIYQNALIMKEIYPDLRIKLLSGGLDTRRMKDGLKKAPQIVIGTPGRIKALFSDSTLRVDLVKMFVVDEADMTIEYGFLDDVDAVFSKMFNPQVMCFSATLPEGLKPFIKKYLNHPQLIEIKDDEKVDPNIEHILINCKHKSYGEALLDILGGFNPYVCLIFANTREECDEVYALFKRNKIKAVLLHGGLDSRQRQRAIKEISSKEVTYVIASDIASRGLDIDAITHVVSLGFPKELSFYIHRSGRTGRNGRHGICYALYQKQDEAAINTLIKQGIKFTPKQYKNGEWRDLKSFDFKRVSYSEKREKEIAKMLKKKNEKVKPNYKKKKTQKIEDIKRKERREYIRKKIQEEKKARYKKAARNKD